MKKVLLYVMKCELKSKFSAEDNFDYIINQWKLFTVRPPVVDAIAKKKPRKEAWVLVDNLIRCDGGDIFFLKQ